MRRGGAAPKVATGASKRSLRVKRLTVRDISQQARSAQFRATTEHRKSEAYPHRIFNRCLYHPF